LTTLLEKGTLKSSENIVLQGTVKTKIKKEDKGENNFSRRLVLQYRLLALLASFPRELQTKVDNFKKNKFLDKDNLKIFTLIITGEKLGKYEKTINKYIAKLNYQEDQGNLVEAEINPIKEWELTIKEINNLNRKTKLKKIELDLKQAEEENNQKEVDRLMRHLGKLLKE
jgi:hypothetical protein